MTQPALLEGIEPQPTIAKAIEPCRLLVYGVAQPQGNKTAMVRNGRAVLVEGRRKEARQSYADWRRAVADTAGAWIRQHPGHRPWDVPVAVEITFALPRPASAPKRVVHPAGRPDLDKLTRAVGDAISRLIYTDDARIVSLRVAKVFATGAPHASITVTPLEDPR